MAVPKRKMSRSNTRHRRANWKASAPQLTPCPCPRKEAVIPHRVCPHCGLYKGRQIVDVP
ncbi:50S ribosomal protein L32 [Micromonospora musae]|uniref:50S ribosomal protein L32 n=1 Tax=Micromonospora musae TaxID=1894970 RepID=UPI0033E515E9